MIEYRINRRVFNKTSAVIPINLIEFFNFNDIIDNTNVEENTNETTDQEEVIEESSSEEGNKKLVYDGRNYNKTMLLCHCDDILDIKVGNTVRVKSNVILDYQQVGYQVQKEYTLNNYYIVDSVNDAEKTFSFLIDNFYPLDVEKITYFNWADKNNSDSEETQLEENSEEDKEPDVYLYCSSPHYFDINDDIMVIFRFPKKEIIENVKVPFKFYNYNTLVGFKEDFDGELWEIIFGVDGQNDSEFVEVIEGERNGNLGGIQVLRDNFLFGEKSNYDLFLERSFVTLDIPISNTFETNLTQTELINEYFVRDEKKKAINSITDIEKDVYYPSIYWRNTQENSESNIEGYIDVQKIKFNLHFREHRGSDWLAVNDSYWNGVSNKTINGVKTKTINGDITDSSVSDLLCFTGFTNDDVHYQKNRLKKSFLRLSYYDSTNPANQNMFGFSTIFFNTGELFAKYIKNFELSGYKQIIYNNEPGEYNTSDGKNGIRVDREYGFDEEKRLSSQMVVKGKNTSNSSSDGFYVYIWKDNETTIPQDLYVKAEFNHAGYGRVIPFMLPFNENPHRIKTFQQILNDFNSKGYDIREYMKYSYIHFKYLYDKDNDVHRYYLDPETYGIQSDPTNEIVINLYEAKIV